MKVYLLEYAGRFFPGSLLIVDETKRNAMNQAKKELEKLGLLEGNGDLTTNDLVEVQTKVRSTLVINKVNYG